MRNLREGRIMNQELTVMYQTDKRVLEIASEISTLEERAGALEIKDDAQDIEAKSTLSLIARQKKALEELRKQFVQPLNDHVKNINSFFKERSTPLAHADAIIRKKVAGYFSEKQAIARKEQERLSRLAEKRQERWDAKAQGEGKAVGPPVPAAIIEEPEKTTKTEAGSVTVRKIWDFKIVDLQQIPRVYMVVDEKKIRAVVKAGIRNIPGAHIYEREEIAVR